MANELFTSLRLVGKDLSGKLLQIVEEHGSSASFVTGSFLWNASRSDSSICLVALHNSFAHYQNVTKKLGFNLKTAVDNKTASVLEPFSMYFENSNEENFEKHVKNYLDDGMKPLIEDLNKTLGSMSGKKCLIIDDLSDLLNMGIEFAEVISFLQYCRKLQEADKDLSLIVCSHVSENCEDHRLLADFISHIAHLRTTVAPLRTGFSASVTGSIEVVGNLEGGFDAVSEKNVFHFKLTDRQIKVFAPGSVGIRG